MYAESATLSRWRHGFEPRWGCSSYRQVRGLVRNFRLGFPPLAGEVLPTDLRPLLLGPLLAPSTPRLPRRWLSARQSNAGQCAGTTGPIVPKGSTARTFTTKQVNARTH